MQLALGSALYQNNCAACHAGSSGNGIPNLMKMNEKSHSEFMDIVLKGIRAKRGMGSFSEILSPTDTDAIYTYLLEEAWRNYEANNELPADHY